MKKLLVLGTVIAVAACEDTPSGSGSTIAPPPDDLNFVRGYRATDDMCQLTGETAFTVEFLDDAADLVSCPTGSDAAASLVGMYDARQVAETGGYTVYTVPRR